MNLRHASKFILAISLAASVGLALPGASLADKKSDKGGGDTGTLQANPFEFVGTSSECNPYPAGSNIVTAAWLHGLGLPDNGGQNTTAVDVATNPNKRDPHTGLLLS